MVGALPATGGTAVLAVASVAAVATGAAVASSLPWYTTFAAVHRRSWSPTRPPLWPCWGPGRLALSLERPGDVRSALLVLVWAAWACADWVGWQGGPAVVRTLGVVGHAALLPLIAHLVVRTWPAWDVLRRAVPWIYGVTLGVAVARLTVTDPLVDAACWQNCTANTLLVIGQPTIALALFRLVLGISLITGVAMVARTSGWPCAAARRREGGICRFSSPRRSSERRPLPTAHSSSSVPLRRR